MKRSLFLLAALFATTTLYIPTATAQQRPSMYGDKVKADVKLRYVYSLEEALARAKAESKPIFFNCFADWAVPCHGMNMYVFSNAEFAQWVEKHFVPLFIDVTQAEHKAIATKYNIKKFAHFLVLDAHGRVQHRIIGGKQLPDFQKDLTLALSPKTSLAGTEARYNTGKASIKEVRAYLNALLFADETERFTQVGTQFLGMLKEKDYPRAENWDILSRLITDANSDLFAKLSDNKAIYVKNVGADKVNGLAESLFYAPLAAMAGGSEPYNAERLLDLYLSMQRFQLPDSSRCYRLHEVAKLRGEQKYDELLTFMEQRGHLLGHERVSLALTLDFPDLSEAQKQRTIAYLRHLATTQTTGTSKHLNTMADRLEHNEGLNIIERGSLSDALAKAKAEGKLVFLDAYTTWCGPCKHMSKNVFPLPEVGRALNPRYVSIKIDMEKGEGIELAKRYQIAAYPTLLVLDTEGRVVKKLLGAQDAPRLINALTAQMPNAEWPYWKVKQAYELGDRSGNVLYHYTRQAVAGDNLAPADAKALLDAWYQPLTDTEFCAPSSWEFVAGQLMRPSPMTERAVRLYKTLCQQNTSQRVDAAFAQGATQAAADRYPSASEQIDTLRRLLTLLEQLPQSSPTLQSARLILKSRIAELSA